MAQENVKEFEKLLRSDEELQTKLQEALKAFDGDKGDEKAVFDATVAPLAAEAGLPYTFEEAVESTQARELDDDELKAVAGGSWCLIIGGGHDSDSNTVETENGAGVTGFGTCEYVGIGLAYY
ncbi:Uncharacterised protein [Slackia heliotrinireducens]|uniref:Nif11 domain-containing protein n=1 Tax=Slackia heliotrinireducens (strain ATCC 29202 / DSM 20476 / NCTC 11029 / RHS 1) TaxID=471855 RepID=C7N7J7_SLAHD|nr:hypothetical protein [Slackia heliotrinireducens]ACV22882.1 hypothetical protein Shel_18660 [Slackia heliotrinireducens DSM 20476]VEH01658.1 Uncharacterised protein [Slackia heliotrinireducens]